MTVKQLLSAIKKTPWKSIWAGEWGLLSCSDWGRHYMSTLRVGTHPFLSRVIFLYVDGKSSAWVEEQDINSFSAYLVGRAKCDPSEIRRACSGLKREVKKALSVIRLLEKKEITWNDYRTYVRVMRAQYIYHVHVKYIVEAMPSSLLQHYLPALQEARVFAEPVFDASRDFERHVANAIAQKTSRSSHSLLALTYDELKRYFSDHVLPSRSELKKRYNHTALYIDKDQFLLLTGSDSRKIEKSLHGDGPAKGLKGQCAYPGVVSGRTRIVLDPRKAKDFQKGDILVTSMTRPDYLALMKKAVGIITDAGGILSHAAITARELRKPCVIGTKSATAVLKDGDRVRVDAKEGIVTKI